MSLSTLLSKIPSDLADRLGWCALHFIWQGAAIGAGLWLMLVLCRRGTAELRHALCGIALLLMAVAPAITWQRLPVLRTQPKVIALPEAVEVPNFPDAAGLSALEGLEPDSAASRPPLTGLRGDREIFLENQSTAFLPGKPVPEAQMPAPWWQRAMGVVWLGGAGLTGLWRLCGLWGTFRLIRRAERAAAELLDQAARMAARCGLRRMPDVRITGRLISPAVAGVLRPVLLLPAAAMAGLSPRELDFVLAHEFAHIRRQDFLLGLLQSLAETLLFFHPAVWWASRRMSFEREQACDDAAMRVTGNRQAGASALARLAELQLQQTAAMAPAAGGGQVLARVRRLLEPAHQPQPPRGQVLVLLPALLTAAAVPLLLLTQRAESQPASSPVPEPPVSAEPETGVEGSNKPTGENPSPPPGNSGEIPASGSASGPAAPAASGAVPPASGTPGEVSEKVAARSLRGSITDRNGVVLAESAFKEMSSSDGTGMKEIRQYPLGATASHVLGFVKAVSTSPEKQAAAPAEETREVEIRRQLATWKANLEALTQFEGNPLIEAAMAYGVEDDTIKQFASQWKKDEVEYEKLTHSGFGLEHPRVRGLASSIRREKEILLEAAENYKVTLASTIRNIETTLLALKGTAENDRTAAGSSSGVMITSLRRQEAEVRTQAAALGKELAELARLSGPGLITGLLAKEGVDPAVKTMASGWQKDRAEYDRKSRAGFDANHPEMAGLAAAMKASEALLAKWVQTQKTGLTRQIAELEKNARILRDQQQKLSAASARKEPGLSGAAGIEKALNNILSSTPAPGGQPQPAVALTLDARIQRISENALRDAHIGRGAAVVLDVTNGDVLAMASVPDFDPNGLVPGIPADIWRQWNADPTSPMVNRALSAHPPGSTFKLVTAMAAGAEGKWNRSWNCSGSVTYGGRPFSCWTVQQGAAPHGTLGLADALKKSCNCWFYQCGNATGIERIEQVARDFGLGEKMEIGIDYEVNDFMPGPQWFALKDAGPWTSSKTANVAIGQGEVKATPMQMAAVAAAVATDGKVWRQRLISKSLIDGVWQSPEPRLEHDLASEGTPLEAFAAIREGMWKTVHDDDGATGKAARSALVTIAGKTGTAQKWRRVPDADGTTPDGEKVADNHSWFIGFAPFDKPRYAFAIVVGNGKSGGSVCAPIARRIMESVTLMNEGKLNADLSPLAVAKGNFDHVESVSYTTALPGQ